MKRIEGEARLCLESDTVINHQ